MKAISLFSSAGIGDLGLKVNGVTTIIACDIIKERIDLFKKNYPKAKTFCGDIWKLQDELINYYLSNFNESLDIVIATPPCQGMSSNGMGTIISNQKKGLRDKNDKRNRLIIPVINIIKKLRPRWVIIENVPNMEKTMIINSEGNKENIIKYLFSELKEDYIGKAQRINCADYGVAQNRKRLVILLTRTEKGKSYLSKRGTFLPESTHSKKADLIRLPWVTVADKIAHLPALDSIKGKNADENNPLHCVPLLDEKKHWWVQNTKEGDTAFNNQCSKCKFDKNPLHGATRAVDGVNRAKSDTPMYCKQCGALLPRPAVIDKNGEIRIMKGYTSAYKRMRWNEPASTLTQNFQYACSDNKLHPEQNRVLSLKEALILQTVTDYEYVFEINGKQVNAGLIRDVIGESVPPKIIDVICKQIKSIEA